MIETVLMKRLGLAHPIIQAPMAGGGDTPQLVAAVCNARALGFIGAAYRTPSQIIETGKEVRNLTDKPFGINLFAPSPVPDYDGDARAAVERVRPFYAELGLSPPTVPRTEGFVFMDQLAAALETDASAFSFTFGALPKDAVRAVKDRGMFLMGTATTVAEAAALEDSGVDAVVAQGSEAGGHRATFLGRFESGLIGTVSLVPQISDVVSIPVVASGGMMDGRGVAAALALGADAVQMGTAFLTCDEAGVPRAYKEALLKATEDETRLTRAFSGRPARGVRNRFMDAYEGCNTDAILPFPLQNLLTRPLRAAAAKEGRADFLSLWAGQGVRLARRQPAAELVASIAKETEQALTRFAPGSGPS